MLRHYASSHCCNNLVGPSALPAGLAGEGMVGRTTLLLIGRTTLLLLLPGRWGLSGRNTLNTLVQGKKKASTSSNDIWENSLSTANANWPFWLFSSTQ